MSATTEGGLRPSLTILDHDSCGYELTLISCDETCQVCVTMAHEAAYDACRAEARKAVKFMYLTADDNTVTQHEVFVTRLYKVDLNEEPF
jgi:hypothetical protein